MIIKERRKAPAFRHGECQDEDIQPCASPFDSIKHINEYGEEYWSARELIPLLEYNEYRFFKKVIDKAINACEATDNKASDHFVQVNEMVTILKMRIIRIMS